MAEVDYHRQFDGQFDGQFDRITHKLIWQHSNSID